jgi:PAS domain S-box-containing protein/putative nucleotidyltransferase with HDIG domain
MSAAQANAPWSVELKVPAAEHRAALVNSVGGVMTAILAAVVLSVFGGQLAGRRLEQAMAGLALPEIEARESADLSIKEISAIRTRLDAANAALRAGEARYRELFESNPQPMWVFDLQTLKFLAVNDAAINHFGYSKPEFLALTIKDIRSTEDVTRLTANVAQLISGFAKAGIHRLRRKDGTLIEADISWHTLVFDGRNAAVALVQDVTEIKRALFAVQEQEGKFRALTEQSLVGIVIVEEDRITYANQRVDEIFGYKDGEAMGRRVAEFVVAADLPRIEMKLRQLLANETSDLKDEFRGRRKDGAEIVIGAHGKGTNISGKQAVIGVIQDITEKQRAEETIREYIMRLEKAITSTVDAVSLMVELRDPYTAGHEHRVGEIAAAIADEMGLDINVQRGLRIAGALHDVGKVAVPAEILSKPSRLTAIEYELVKNHAQQGYEVLRGIDFPWPIAEVARQHHERMDGSGYPRGLIGDAILIEARITAVADVVESMAAHRPYRPGLGLGKALEEIERGKGTLYDPEVAAACLRLFRDRGYQIPV